MVDENARLVVACVAGAVGLMLGILIGNMIGETTMRREAAAAGHAEYFFDDKNQVQWRWKLLPAEQTPTGEPK